jgi:hypothetical protein
MRIGITRVRRTVEGNVIIARIYETLIRDFKELKVGLQPKALFQQMD